MINNNRFRFPWHKDFVIYLNRLINDKINLYIVTKIWSKKINFTQDLINMYIIKTYKNGMYLVVFY